MLFTNAKNKCLFTVTLMQWDLLYMLGINTELTEIYIEPTFVNVPFSHAATIGSRTH